MPSMRGQTFLRRALDDTYDQHLQIMRDVPRPWPSSDELECIVNKADSDGLFMFALTVVKFVGDKIHNLYRPFSGRASMCCLQVLLWI